MAGGSDTVQTTQNQSSMSQMSYPQYTQDANKALTMGGFMMGAPFMQIPKEARAGFTPDQMQAFDMVRQNAQEQFVPGATQVPTGQSYQAAQVGPASMMQPHLTNPNSIASYMNPYMDSVIDPAVQQLRRNTNAQMADIGARAASTAAMGGGSSEAMERALARRGSNENLVNMVTGLMSQGYDRAQNFAQGETGILNQAEAANQAARNNFALQDAAYRQQANMGNPQLALETAQLQDAMRTSDLARRLQAINSTLGIGNQQQLFAQSAIDVPWDMLQRIAAITPQGVYNTTQNSQSEGTATRPNEAPSPFAQLLGAGLTIAGMPAGGGSSLIGKAFG